MYIATGDIDDMQLPRPAASAGTSAGGVVDGKTLLDTLFSGKNLTRLPLIC